LQSVRPIDIFFIGVRILGTSLIALGAYLCLYSAIVFATYSRPVAPLSLDTIDYTQDQFRCDNAFVGRVAGCVIPWGTADMDFFTSVTPEIVSHISRAQASGLPGAPGGTPLHRSTDTLANNEAYNRACFQTPVVLGKSCDEYPFKSAEEGLAG